MKVILYVIFALFLAGCTVTLDHHRGNWEIIIEPQPVIEVVHPRYSDGYAVLFLHDSARYTMHFDMDRRRAYVYDHRTGRWEDIYFTYRRNTYSQHIRLTIHNGPSINGYLIIHGNTATLRDGNWRTGYNSGSVDLTFYRRVW